MAVMGSADVGFLLSGGRSLLGRVTTLDEDREALIEETTALGDAWQNSAYIGVKRWMLSQSGFYDDAANSVNAALATPGVSSVVTYAPDGNTTGSGFGGSPAVQVAYKRQIQRGALTKAEANYVGEGNHDEGKILAPLAARGAASDTHTTSVDNAASSANGGVGYLELTSLTLGGYTNLVVKIQHSTDNSSFVDLITFTAETAAPDGQRKTVAGTINRYTDALWSWTGSGSGQTATWFAGLARN